MAYSNQTTHYGLPQPTSGDKSTFLDTNEAFGRVDSALYGAATDATSAKQQADDLALEVNDLKVSVLDLKSSVLDAKTDINLLMANMGQAMTDINSLQTDTIKLKLDVTDIMVSQLPNKIDTFSGQVEDAEQTSYTAVTADGIAYDETNNQLLLKVDGADTVIPFSRGSSGRGVIKEYLSFANVPYAEGGYQVVGGIFIDEEGSLTNIPANTPKANFIPMQDLIKDYYLSTTSSLTIGREGYYIITTGTPVQNAVVAHYSEDQVLSNMSNAASAGFTIIYLGETNPFA